MKSRALCLALLLGAAIWLATQPSRAANPSSAAYSRDGSRLFWILHISDTHIGASTYEGPDASPHLEWLLDEGFAVIDPELLVITGDLVDGSLGPIPVSGQSLVEWNEYRALVDGAGMSTDFFLDLPGNHDCYGDIGLTYYLAHSLNGETFDALFREIVLSFPFGDYLIFGLNSAGNGRNPIYEAPAFTQDEIQALGASLAAHDDLPLALLFAHHPIDYPADASDVITLAEDHEAFYVHGHVHSHGTYLNNGVLSARVSTLGKGDVDNVAVLAVDNNAVSYAATSTADPWPFVLITAPANARLMTGDLNVYAYPVCNTGEENPVRALVFDSAPVTQVTFTPAGGAAVPMTQDPVEPRLWHGAWDTRGLAEGETTLTVTAQGSGSRSAEVAVMLADVPCPGPVESHPDAGLPDSGAPPDPDAGESADASTSPPLSDNSGCGCRSATTRPSLPLLLFLGLLGTVLCLRRRRCDDQRRQSGRTGG